ncbi:hypothetical protein CFP65_5776 [Kitasatospora sp. MMS16-BH015]|uniref:hypothetical protein n=1 Tax=Kitasatospora sp. MMS16-BH015 TaxID=2018025 RepID=UPI000CA0D986|nr:hypothetical protein [Kitasatospora sp. MMS16-BH015]AUG80462.1 hypothetical protein CFP65_5776 [Kitasatospora sp. MMS16-BH015]
MNKLKKTVFGVLAGLTLALGAAGTGHAAAEPNSVFLNPGVCLTPNHYLQAGYNQLAFQNDGNIVAKWQGSPAYQFPNTWGQATRFCMQADGNLVAYGNQNQVLWALNQVDGNRYYAGDVLAVQTDGNLVVYRDYGNGDVLWTTNTYHPGF